MRIHVEFGALGLNIVNIDNPDGGFKGLSDFRRDIHLVRKVKLNFLCLRLQIEDKGHPTPAPPALFQDGRDFRKRLVVIREYPHAVGNIRRQ